VAGMRTGGTVNLELGEDHVAQPHERRVAPEPSFAPSLTLLLAAGASEVQPSGAPLACSLRRGNKNVEIRESQAVLALLIATPANALAAAALAELVSRGRPSRKGSPRLWCGGRGSLLDEGVELNRTVWVKRSSSPLRHRTTNAAGELAEGPLGTSATL
jgi:hypothetical protein